MKFHIVSEGEGQPILFIHAGVADSRMWRGQIGLDGYRTIAYDQRGFGETPLVDEPYTDKDDALAVLDRVGADSAVVVGCSIGAGTAMQMAIEDGERVDKLVLVGAYPSGWVPEGGFAENPLEEEAEKAAEAGDLERVLEIDYLMWGVGYGREENAVKAGFKDLFADMDRIALQSEADRNTHITHRQYKINDRLDEIDVPTLLVSGAHDESPVIQASHYLAERLSDRPPVVINGAAHLPSLEQPEEFNRQLVEFLSN